MVFQRDASHSIPAAAPCLYHKDSTSDLDSGLITLRVNLGSRLCSCPCIHAVVNNAASSRLALSAPSLAGRAGGVRGTDLALLVVLGLRFKIFLDSLPIAWQVDASCPMVRSVHIQQSFHIANRHGICLDDLRHTRAFIITLLPNKLGTDDKTVDSATSMLARHSPTRYRTISKGPLAQQLRRRQPARCPA